MTEQLFNKHLTSTRAYGYTESTKDIHMDTEVRMLKTDRQLLIEAANDGQDWQDVFRNSLSRHRGQRNLVALVSADVGISNPTLYKYCRALGINLNDYRTPTVTS